MHIEFLLEEPIVRRAQREAKSMGKTLEGLLLDEIQRLSDIATDETPTEDPEDRPGIVSVSMRRTAREEIYRLD
jgi:hypothetical protein